MCTAVAKGSMSFEMAFGRRFGTDSGMRADMCLDTLAVGKGSVDSIVSAGSIHLWWKLSGSTK